MRGSVVDLFAAGAPQPFRLDLFDDQIESVRVFDPADQRSGARLAAVPLLPAREIPSSPEADRRVQGALARALRRRPAEKQRLPRRHGRPDAGGHRSLAAPLLQPDLRPLRLPARRQRDRGPGGSRPHARRPAGRRSRQRHEDRRHDRERPLLPPAEAFVPAAEALSALAGHPRIQLTPVKVEPIGAATAFENFASGPPPDLRADTRAAAPARQARALRRRRLTDASS